MEMLVPFRVFDWLPSAENVKDQVAFVCTHLLKKKRECENCVQFVPICPENIVVVPFCHDYLYYGEQPRYAKTVPFFCVAWTLLLSEEVILQRRNSDLVSPGVGTRNSFGCWAQLPRADSRTL